MKSAHNFQPPYRQYAAICAIRGHRADLRDRTSGERLITDSITADATLGAVTSLYGQDKSETHARKRLAILLAQRVVRRLQLYFLNQNP